MNAVYIALFGFFVTHSVSAQVKYVWDLVKPSLDAGGVIELMLNAQPGVSYPIYNSLPQTGFVCSKPGYYADVDTQCQGFHRCDLNGNMTSYLCVNTTIFNQITLVCDYWFNVDCPRTNEFVDFANSRLYSDQPLFDTPPADYVPPNSKVAGQAQVSQQTLPQSSRKQPPSPASVSANKLITPSKKQAMAVTSTTTTPAPTDDVSQDQTSQSADTTDQPAPDMQTTLPAADQQASPDDQPADIQTPTPGRQTNQALVSQSDSLKPQEASKGPDSNYNNGSAVAQPAAGKNNNTVSGMKKAVAGKPASPVVAAAGLARVQGTAGTQTQLVKIQPAAVRPRPTPQRG